MFKKILWTVLVILGVVYPSQSATIESTKRCQLAVNPLEYGFFAPLVFDETSKEFAKTDDNVILIDIGKTVTVSCDPGYFKSFPSSRVLKAKCIEGEELELEDGIRKLWSADFACDLRVVEEILTRSLTGCPTNAESSEFGYINPLTKATDIVGEACYSVEEGRTIFVHAVSSGALKTVPESYLRVGRHPESRNKMNLFRVLRQDTINGAFEEKMGGIQHVPMMGSKSLVTADMLPSNQLHLVNRLIWNYGISHNDETLKEWKALQKALGALQSKSNVEYWAGVSGVQILKDAQGETFDFYLKDKKYPVPKYFWLVIKSGDKSTGVLFQNVPRNLKQTLDEGIIQCPEFCSTISWLEALKNIDETAGIQCCSVRRLKKIIPEVPDIPTISEKQDVTF
ncbi:hypothetical protein DMENIID0001_141920 [Sergentomyia squamirostris]